MTMKRTDLEKRQALKLENQRKHNDAGRFGRPSTDAAKVGADGKPRKPSLMDALLARTKKD
ncbi:MAG TPA: hypothetical protein VFW68_13290 [Rhodocyclaceae bacterium]|nr:hypothetical protein [Rhodocyclaceae bacterium]